VQALRLTLAFIVLGVVLPGCPKPLPPPQPQPPDQSASYCPTAVSVRTADVCQDVFTSDGHPCAVCHGGSACIATGIEVYCVGTGNCAAAIVNGECSLVRTPAPHR
jgi:hypothetical protein